jgi:F0F1-type ATP synthase assembly protein I
MFKKLLLSIKKWYQGTSRLETFDKLQMPNVKVMPILITEYHWTAKIVRVIVGFFNNHSGKIVSAILTLVVAIILYHYQNDHKDKEIEKVPMESKHKFQT